MSDSQGFIIIQEQKHFKKDGETNLVGDTEAVTFARRSSGSMLK